MSHAVPVTSTMFIEVELRGNYIPLTPARLYGPPEDCHPAEGNEFEDVKAFVRGNEVELTPKELEEAEQALRDALVELD